MVQVYKIVFALMVFVALPASVHAATLSLSPSSNSLSIGEFFTLRVVVSSDTSINAVSGIISIPKSFTIDSVSKANSILNFWVSEPSFSNTDGTVNFEGVALSGFQGSGGTVLSVRLRTVNKNPAPITFQTAQILANDGQGTNITGGLSGASLTVVDALPPTKSLPVEQSVIIQPATTTFPEPQIIPKLEIYLDEKHPNPVIIGVSDFPNEQILLAFTSGGGSKVFVKKIAETNGDFTILIPDSLKYGVYTVDAEIFKANGEIVKQSNTITVTVGNPVSDISWGLLSIIALLLIVIVFQFFKSHRYFRSFLKMFCLLLSLLFVGDSTVRAQSINVDASKLVSHAEVYFSPRSGTFVEGSTFEVPIILNTKGNNINGIDIRINFDKNRLAIIKPSSGKSIVGVWVEPPKYDNIRGTASYVGVIPDGIVTSSGLIGSITFKALTTGTASVKITLGSTLLLNNGMGSEISFDSLKADYTIIPKAPDGPAIFSETHPFQEGWYNNNNPVISWNRDAAVSGFSFELDNKPGTIPDNVIDSAETTKTFEDLNDGLWYFHVKAYKNGVWGTTGSFLVKIDTAPPADFKPISNYVVAAVTFSERTLISFFTTDNLSGIDHYEVGVIDKDQPITESPVFIESESPFQIPLNDRSNLRVIVRAVDKANNVRDVSIDVEPPILIVKFIQDYLVYILTAVILIGILGSITHYLIKHHVFRHLKQITKILRDK